MRVKRILFVVMAAMLTVSLLSGCGKEETKKETASSTGSNIIKKSEPQEGDTSANKNYEVALDERDKKTAYQYSLEDISYIDTVTGGSVSVGMTIEEIEKIAGTSMLDDPYYRIYDGLIVQFNDEGKAFSLLISNGLFINEAQSTRFVTPRGVGLLTPRGEFVKAYGDVSGDNTIRYFMIEDKSVEYLGTSLTAEQEKKYSGKIFAQEFLFDKATDKISAIRISNIEG